MKTNLRSLAVIASTAMFLTGCFGQNPSGALNSKRAAGKNNAPQLNLTQTVTAAEQTVANGAVMVAQAVVNQPSWVVIHADVKGNFGPALGQTLIPAGESKDVKVIIEESKTTPTLYAVLHSDIGQAGVYDALDEQSVLKQGLAYMIAPFKITNAAMVKPILPATEDGAPIKRFNLEVKKYSFSPTTLTAQQGDHIKITVKSIDLEDEFVIPGYNINLGLTSGTAYLVEFTATQSGEFTFTCSAACASTHPEMHGKLVIK